MMGAIVGWTLVTGLLMLISAFALGLPLALMRRAAPRVRVSGTVHLVVIMTGAVALWFLIPVAIHALVGRVPY